MTVREVYSAIRKTLADAGCDSAAFDAGCLLEHAAGISRARLPLDGDTPVAADTVDALTLLAARRASGEPLQYLLGCWDFLSLTLAVGPGVLVPRPDTELLCETAAGLLYGPSPRVLDLCAGSGCVALGTASLYPGARVTAVELSDDAFAYLRRNCTAYPGFDVTPVKGDVLHGPCVPGIFDAILSNPPYIPSGDIPGLSAEVRHEPRMALDGGDGLVFYRAIAALWTPMLAPGGVCAVEVGIGQAGEVAALWENAGLGHIMIKQDLSGIDRVVIGYSFV